MIELEFAYVALQAAEDKTICIKFSNYVRKPKWQRAFIKHFIKHNIQYIKYCKSEICLILIHGLYTTESAVLLKRKLHF